MASGVDPFVDRVAGNPSAASAFNAMIGVRRRAGRPGYLRLRVAIFNGGGYWFCWRLARLSLDRRGFSAVFAEKPRRSRVQPQGRGGWGMCYR